MDGDFSLVHPELARRYLLIKADVKKEMGFDIRATQCLRTIEEQNALYAQGRTTPGSIVTWAMGGESWHNFGLAIDICFSGKDPYFDQNSYKTVYWKKFGEIVERQGLVWGGGVSYPKDKKDLPHMQLTMGLSLGEIKSIHNSGGMPAVWSEIDRRLKGDKNDTSRICDASESDASEVS